MIYICSSIVSHLFTVLSEHWRSRARELYETGLPTPLRNNWISVSIDVISRTFYIQIKIQPDGDIEVRVKKALKNDKNITKQRQKEIETKNLAFQSKEGNPFLLQSQAQIKIKRTQQTKMIEGKICASYQCEQYTRKKIAVAVNFCNAIAFLSENRKINKSVELVQNIF